LKKIGIANIDFAKISIAIFYSAKIGIAKICIANYSLPN